MYCPGVLRNILQPNQFSLLTSIVLLVLVLQLCACSDDPASPEPAPVSPQSLDWLWQNPLPQGNHLREVAFSDGVTGIVVVCPASNVRTVSSLKLMDTLEYNDFTRGVYHDREQRS